MKTKTFLLIVAACFGLNAYPQATSLTVDNQTPGWLSSKISYGDQQTVYDLVITGYMNEDDMKFVGTLMKQYSLKRLDMEKVNVVSANAENNNQLPENMFDINWPDKSHMEKIVLPLSITSIYQEQYGGGKGCFSGWLNVDTLVLGGPSMPTIKNYYCPLKLK